MDEKIEKALLIKALQKKEEHKDNLSKTNNDCFIPLFSNKSRFLVLKGGGGSGKSIFVGRKVLDRIINERGHRILVCRKVAKTLRESCFQQLKSQISEHYDMSQFEINKTDMTITHKNSNQILFVGLDDAEKLKSIYNITSIWIEEATELDEQSFNQLDIRLRGKTSNYKQIIISFNPIHANHWLKKRFFDTKNDDVTISETTYKDNRFLDDAAKKVLESFKDTDPYYYTVYSEGNWGITGKTIFDAKQISERIEHLKQQEYWQGYFIYKLDIADKIIDKTITFVSDQTGYIRIYNHPKTGYPYVIGGDTSGEGSDSFTAQVLDNLTGKQVATLKHKFDEDMYAKQVYCLGKYYNNALVSIEVNYSTYPIKELERLGYHYQYIREHVDTYLNNTKKSYGFRTDKMTRPLIIANLVQIVRDHIELFSDIETLEEMLTFVRNENGRAEAMSGSHDDLTMALCIAYYCRSSGRHTIEAVRYQLPKDLPEDVRQDLEDDPAALKLYLESKSLLQQ